MTATASRVQYVDHGGWVGLAPDSWSVGPLRRFCEITLGKMVAKESTVTVPTRPYLRAAHVQPGGILTLADIKEMPFTRDEAIKLKLSAGDVVVVEGGAGYGRSAVLREDLTGWGFQNSINRVRPCVGSGRFTNYALLAAQSSGYFETLINTATIPHLTAEKLADVQIAWPGESVQRQIADYLDEHTAKIDALIGKQERLIETLAERRQAVISHAVTKGLDPNAPMRGSGNEWVGQIPRHWNVPKIRQLARLISKGTTPSTIGATYQDHGVRFIRGEDLQGGKITPDESRFISDETHDILGRSKLAAGDILFVIAGSLGKTAVVGAENLPANTNQAVAFIRPKLNQDSKYIRYWLSSSAVAAITSLASVTAAQPNLSMENLGNFPIPVGPLAEQKDIVAHLDRETAQIDALSAKAREMIDVLKERRQALISAAVTGKIDVKGLA